MQTHHIRLDAGQSHFAWYDKGSQVIVLDGALAVTLRHGGLDWLPDAPQHIRRLLDEGECLTLETAGHVALSAGGTGAVSTTVVELGERPGVLAGWRAALRRLSARIRGGHRVREHS
ncbi:hypothetical protein BLA9940_00625 [Burkholderia aenigmatica]|uniref:Uncharacterized protein n=1 Tax=Burkholderia aenigmatica TaxID=2015348 RepID=A0A6J5JAX9_9BURK|nr:MULTISPECIES: hypothetical protein [Burkholderia]AYQ43189.1 hypothetical protein CVS37_36225 [Burkholderia lata]UKD15128.1 hypothetical protein L3V59_19400 [Burkholderia aenigmatica]CAB3968571.1 hypothetical protein BLA3211_05038 [Burkholderia aenigmatica]VWC40360.1 hypothetical protein BLA9940_00625 [Burkholderia aenigmatica]